MTWIDGSFAVRHDATRAARRRARLRRTAILKSQHWSEELKVLIRHGTSQMTWNADAPPFTPETFQTSDMQCDLVLQHLAPFVAGEENECPTGSCDDVEPNCICENVLTSDRDMVYEETSPLEPELFSACDKESGAGVSCEKPNVDSEPLVREDYCAMDSISACSKACGKEDADEGNSKAGRTDGKSFIASFTERMHKLNSIFDSRPAMSVREDWQIWHHEANLEVQSAIEWLNKVKKSADDEVSQHIDDVRPFLINWENKLKEQLADFKDASGRTANRKDQHCKKKKAKR